MTSFHLNHFHEDPVSKQSLSDVLGVGASTCEFVVGGDDIQPTTQIRSTDALFFLILKIPASSQSLEVS